MCAVMPTRRLRQGPVEESVRRLLPAEARGAEVAPRSPIGSNALKVYVDGDPDAVGRSLEEEPWVEAVAIRPGHLYLRVDTESLVSWLTAPPPSRTEERRGLEVEAGRVTLDDEMSLTECRSTVTRRSLEALLGDEVDPEEAVAVGRVDVRNGPLRMRCSGRVQAADVEDEVIRHLERLRVPGSPENAACAISLAFLATSRKKHVSIDDSWIARAAGIMRDLDEATGAHSLRVAAAPASEDQVRSLAFEINLLARHTDLARDRRDPVYLTRSLRALVRDVAELPPVHPLHTGAIEAISFSLGLLVPEWSRGTLGSNAR